MNRWLRELMVAGASAILAACGGLSAKSETVPFEVVFTATNDDGEHVPGVVFSADSNTAGKTDDRGELHVVIRGLDGHSASIKAVCPPTFVSPEVATTLRLAKVRKLGEEQSSKLRADVVCTRKLRNVVVVVQTTNAPPLPVHISGTPVGETNRRGSAHYLLQLDRDVSAVTVTLGTASVAALRPQNPSRTFDLVGQDSILIVDQTFTMRRTAGSPKARRPVPYRLGS